MTPAKTIQGNKNKENLKQKYKQPVKRRRKQNNWKRIQKKERRKEDIKNWKVKQSMLLNKMVAVSGINKIK